ncbi:MAG: NAD(P)H-dependent oxidoreductase [Deltaproteobacteria bacterium]|nr:NAD(P)H-dependent oxidoreductase [Deltaproteobacteria bacterium]
MKVLALNSSARTGDVSKTEIMVDHLAMGMREAGAEVEIINLKKVKIKYCTGCFTCWTKTPGACIHHDDMTNDIYPKFVKCDLCVLATPLYHYTVNAQMKAFIERTLPTNQPFFVECGGVTGHPDRFELPSMVVLSVAGFPELSVFDQLRSYVNFLYRDRLVAEIYRPSAEGLKVPTNDPGINDILEATIQGGRELATSKKVSPETLNRIQKETNNFEDFTLLGNLAWKTCIAEGVTMGEFQKKEMTPRPDSVETFLILMKHGFNAEKALDAKVKIQFNFTGQIEGTCFFDIKNGTINASPGVLENSDLTIDSPFEIWMDILTRKVDGAEMFMQGKYSVEGNIELLMNMHRFFGKNSGNVELTT